MSKLNKDFLPEVQIEGRRGFYPVHSPEEWSGLPLPMKCATWEAGVKKVIFDTFLSNYGISARIEVHAEDAFKALFTSCAEGPLLYSICAVRMNDGRECAAKWTQDTETGAYGIFNLSGRLLGRQGGYRGHVPANCYKDETGAWKLDCSHTNDENGTVTRCAL